MITSPLFCLPLLLLWNSNINEVEANRLPLLIALCYCNAEDIWGFSDYLNHSKAFFMI